MPFRIELRQNSLNKFFVTRFSGADKILVRQPEPFRKGSPTLGQFITVLLGTFTFRSSSLLHLLAMFIQAGQIEHFFTETAARPSDHVRDNLFIGMTKMRLAIHVIDRSRN